MVNSIKISPKDNVSTVTIEINVGDIVIFNCKGIEEEIIAQEKILINHKIAVEDIPKGSEVIKYAESIGVAIKDIKKGYYVHTHNVRSKCQI